MADPAAVVVAVVEAATRADRAAVERAAGWAAAAVVVVAEAMDWAAAVVVDRAGRLAGVEARAVAAEAAAVGLAG